MEKYVCIIGFDAHEFRVFQEKLTRPIVAYEMLPKLWLKDGELWVQAPSSLKYVPVSHVVFHGIFEDDYESICGLALWGGPCLPNAEAMMETRLKFANLVRALKYSRFNTPNRGFCSARAEIYMPQEHVAKWGNWHCGENKERFQNTWKATYPSILEPFFHGNAVRVAMIGEHYWQIQLAGEEWLKSIHHPNAHFMTPDPELVEDTQQIARRFGLELLANDYIVTESGSKHLLEVNQIPNVTLFPELWETYVAYTLNWIQTH